MSVFQTAVNKIGLGKLFLFTIAAGVAAGIITANLVGHGIVMDRTEFDVLFLANIKNMEINKNHFFWMVFGKRFRDFILIWIFAVTVLWPFYSFGTLFYHGFLCGFLLTIGIMLYGLGGIVLMLSYCLPQYLFYIPVFLLSLFRGYQLYRRLYRYSYDKNPNKWKLFWEYAPGFFVLLAGLLLGCLLEAYINVWIVQKTVTLF